MSVARINNEDFHYTLNGPDSAPVVVLSNSLGTTQAMWAGQVDALRGRFRVLTYDTRGHGLSVKNNGPYAMDQLGNDVVQLLDTLGIKQASFCGISMGGLIGQWLGVNAPQRIDKLIVCNTAARIGTPEGWLDRAALVRSQGMGPVADGTIPRWFTNDFATDQKDMVDAMLSELRQTDAEGYASCCDALAYADFREQIASISVPTLVVAGLHDPVTTPADADFMAQRITGAQRVDLPASHLSNIEANDAFNVAISDFLTQN
ncbi:3-oxoadipate enol-lactonase [Candidimonas sp. SYP-B2681]|uniref:3-oxoadipate enol-lactonase n=1 Tax=Candidimonas sp. SYP-B2681 TaxID=2497686 RepID=UPI000F873E23|nr:3-oxoadipate enol-lactonase [Candidimonas sp. SYP-B2681]RTZ47599.1 3-oxoadipate enol-lactonase [Candidimonas sp. SYP-B2681]